MHRSDTYCTVHCAVLYASWPIQYIGGTTAASRLDLGGQQIVLSDFLPPDAIECSTVPGKKRLIHIQ